MTPPDCDTQATTLELPPEGSTFNGPKTVRGKATLCDRVRRISKVPPEGLQQPQDSAGKTHHLTPEVAECAAVPDSFESKQPGATANEAMRVSAIDAWIANCPVVLPEAIAVGIRAMAQTTSGIR
jgi:hypothetical protein